MKEKSSWISVSDLVAKQKASIEGLHLEYLKKAAQLGEQDGRLNLPRQEDNNISPNEELLKHKYQQLIADCYKKGKPYLDQPHVDYHDSINKLNEIEHNKELVLQERLEVISKKKEDSLAFIDTNFDKHKTQLDNQDKIASRDYMTAKQNLERMQNMLGRKAPVIHFKSTVAYILLLLGIGLCEIPLNLQIFQKFGEAFFITIIMASSLAIAIPVLAHFAGVLIKQRNEKEEYTFWAAISVLLFVVFNFGISIFRTAVLADGVGEPPSTLNLVIFTCLNLILFLIGLLAAYFRHDESYELEYHYNKYQQVRKKYIKAKKGIDSQMINIEKSKAQKIKQVQQAYLTDKEMVNSSVERLLFQKKQAAITYDKLLNSLIGLEEYLDACYRSAVSKYRANNLTNRNDHLSPKSWSNSIKPLTFMFKTTPELDPN